VPSEVFLRDILYVMLEIYETLRACQKGGYLTQHLEEPAYKADVKEALQKEAVQRLTNLYWKFSTDVLKILMQLKSDVKPHAQVALPVPACWRHSSPPWPHGAECSRLLAALRTKGEQPSRSRPNGGAAPAVRPRGPASVSRCHRGDTAAFHDVVVSAAFHDSAAFHAPQVSEVEEPEDILAEERQRLQARALRRQQSSMARSSMESYGAFPAFSAPAGAS
jgi:hypothetical protein